jgi:hypothetical protein
MSWLKESVLPPAIKFFFFKACDMMIIMRLPLPSAPQGNVACAAVLHAGGSSPKTLQTLH